MARGRPSKYKPEFVGMANALASFGATDVQIADKLYVDIATLMRWKTKYPDFCEALKQGKVDPDDQVEMSLFQSAMSGVPTSMIFWLKNRRPDRWRDRTEHKIEGSIEIDPVQRQIAMETEGMTAGEKRDYIARKLKERGML